MQPKIDHSCFKTLSKDNREYIITHLRNNLYSTYSFG